MCWCTKHAVVYQACCGVPSMLWRTSAMRSRRHGDAVGTRGQPVDLARVGVVVELCDLGPEESPGRRRAGFGATSSASAASRSPSSNARTRPAHEVVGCECAGVLVCVCVAGFIALDNGGPDLWWYRQCSSR